jgi:hypothetical protein
MTKTRKLRAKMASTTSTIPKRILLASLIQLRKSRGYPYGEPRPVISLKLFADPDLAYSPPEPLHYAMLATEGVLVVRVLAPILEPLPSGRVSSWCPALLAFPFY